MKESTIQWQPLIDPTSKDEMVVMDSSNWSPHIMWLLLVSARKIY
jgi:hypothetical protein